MSPGDFQQPPCCTDESLPENEGTQGKADPQCQRLLGMSLERLQPAVLEHRLSWHLSQLQKPINNNCYYYYFAWVG